MAVMNAQDAVDRAEPLTSAAAYAQCRDAALAESAIGAIGLEIESHLVDLDHVPWERVEADRGWRGVCTIDRRTIRPPDRARQLETTLEG